MVSRTIVSLLVIIACAYGYTDCGSKVGSVTSVSISNCDDPDVKCILKRKTNATIEIGFTTSTDSTDLKAVVHGVVLGVSIPFDLPNPNGCKDSGVTCPISSGNSYSYKSTLPVRASYPRVSVDVKWELQDQYGNDIVCVLIPAQIK